MSLKRVKHCLVEKNATKVSVNLLLQEFLPIPFIMISSSQVHMACL